MSTLYISPKISPAGSIYDAIPECVGKDDDDHRLFLVTNEEEHDAVLESLYYEEQRGNLLLSNSGMMTLNVFVVREHLRPMHVLVVDCSLRVERFWLAFKEVIEVSATKEDFIPRFVAMFKSRAKEFYSPRARIGIEERAALHYKAFSDEITSGINWLTLRGGFDKVKKLFIERRFAFKRADWSEIHVTKALKEVMSRNRLILDTLVQNNISEYCEASGAAVFEAYRRSLDMLCLPSTLIVKTSTRCACDGEPLFQEVILRGKRPIESIFESSVLCSHISKGRLLDRPILEAAYLLLGLSEERIEVAVEDESMEVKSLGTPDRHLELGCGAGAILGAGGVLK
jgi:hypothetical protein